MRDNEAILRDLGQVTDPIFLGLLLGVDAVFVLLHVLLRSSNVLFDLSTDFGYSEIFQYIKEYWIAIVLFAMCWRTREGIYGAWALLFVYLLCDDALEIHENVGGAWRSYYAPAFGLRARDFGELAVSVVAGSVFLVLISFFYLRCSNGAKDVSKDLTVLLGVLVFFGVFVDMLHIATQGLPLRGLYVLEDGGEMVAMSLIASYVVHLPERQGHSRSSLWQLTRAAMARRSSRAKVGA